MGRLAFTPITTAEDDPRIIPSEVNRFVLNELVVNGDTARLYYKNNDGDLLDVFNQSLDTYGEDSEDVAGEWGEFPKLRKFIYNCLSSFVDGTGVYQVRGYGKTDPDYTLDKANGFLAGILRSLSVLDAQSFMRNLEIVGESYTYDAAVPPTGTRNGSIGIYNNGGTVYPFYVRSPETDTENTPDNREDDIAAIDPTGRIITHAGFGLYSNASGKGWDDGSFLFNVDSSGNVTAVSFTQASKREFKEQIEPLSEDALAIINDIDVIKFKYKADPAKEQRVGFIADDTHELVAGKDHDKYDLGNTVGVLLKAVQQMSAEIIQLQNRVNELEESSYENF